MNWSSHCGEQYGDSLYMRRRATEGLAGPLLGTYLEETRADSGRGLCPGVLHSGSVPNNPDTEAACVSTGRRVEKEAVVRVCVGYRSAVSRSERVPLAAARIGLESSTEMSQRSTHVTHMWTLQHGADGPVYGTETDSEKQTKENKALGYKGAGGW